ncbi:hypothetical protein CLV63_1367 [Murinocardiopsis flavida]|uniref:Uncharacterized protein n=1 Tax=Murinocardiopsis flavida TaxID=645275 RepID=A0A2P8CML1_9ACTN|nr:hypothetical protein [Murinocardiopsis flavida]PSK86206.1 hypothetical protein CLV63_1367 [Murinocardiopsis flavida]
MAAHTASQQSSGIVHNAEVAVPGFAIGLVGGLFAAAVGATAGLPSALTLTVAAALGLPLALLGAGYCLLVAHHRIPLGAVYPVALYWLVGFPLARLFDEYTVAAVMGSETVLREPLWEFLVFQALLSVGYAIGFLWLHERIAPHWFIRIQQHNPLAADLVQRYLEHLSTIGRRRGSAERGRGNAPT